MSNLPVDRDKNYMKETWGTTKLITDYDSLSHLEAPPGSTTGNHYTYGFGFFKERVMSGSEELLREIHHDNLTPKTDNIHADSEITVKHDLKTQTTLHEQIRNDDDYDDWGYGTEPTYGKKW
jgi:hypothetical protein